MNGCNTALAQRLFEPEIEVRRVDADKHIRRIRSPAIDERATQSEQPRQYLDRLDQPHHGQGIGGLPDIATGLAHRRTGDTFHLDRRIDFLECAN